MFDKTEKLPPDSIFGTVEKFKNDPNPDKINLSVGVYTDEEGKPFVFESVKKAAATIETDNFNYLPIGGDANFLKNTQKLYFGERGYKLASQQTCGGTHALSIFSQLVHAQQGSVDILVGTPTWDNYFQIFDSHNIVQFAHLDEHKEVNVEAYEKACKDARENSVLILQGGDTHNPTGKNISISDLEKLVTIIESKKMFVLVDFAYLGFGEGFGEDREFLTYLFENINNIACTVSYSKNASLYQHRTGALFVKSSVEEQKTAIESQLQFLVRKSVSNMPAFGSHIVNLLFEKHFASWKKEVDEARKSIDSRRERLVATLPEDFSHIKNTRGMFCLTGLTAEEVISLQNSASVYMLENGRINFAGIKSSDIERIASAIKSLKK